MAAPWDDGPVQRRPSDLNVPESRPRSPSLSHVRSCCDFHSAAASNDVAASDSTELDICADSITDFFTCLAQYAFDRADRPLGVSGNSADRLLFDVSTSKELGVAWREAVDDFADPLHHFLAVPSDGTGKLVVARIDFIHVRA